MAEWPTGTVTFLFTDIEGSTRLLSELGRGYDTVLAEHQRTLRESFAAHEGREVDTQGDSFFVAFSRAGDAVASAVEAQRALAQHAWPNGVQSVCGWVFTPASPVPRVSATSGLACTELHGLVQQGTAVRSCSRTPRGSSSRTSCHRIRHCVT